jgi:hypothetical protein
VAGVGALFAVAPFAAATPLNPSMDRNVGYDVDAESAGVAENTVQLAQRIVIEREPEIRFIRPEREIRVRIEEPGHYEDQKLLVKPGHFEEYQVWVPERYDPDLNATFHGHYETRQRWVPDVYEYRKVWVPAR